MDRRKSQLIIRLISRALIAELVEIGYDNIETMMDTALSNGIMYGVLDPDKAFELGEAQLDNKSFLSLFHEEMSEDDVKKLVRSNIIESFDKAAEAAQQIIDNEDAHGSQNDGFEGLANPQNN